MVFSAASILVKLRSKFAILHLVIRLLLLGVPHPAGW